MSANTVSPLEIVGGDDSADLFATFAFLQNNCSRFVGRANNPNPNSSFFSLQQLYQLIIIMLVYLELACASLPGANM